MTKHIVICADRHMGQSAMVEKLLSDYTGTVYGFFTRTTEKREDGYHSIYIYPAGSTERPRDRVNHVGDCNSRQRTVNPDVFEDLGVKYLQHGDEGIIVMDELGFMEIDSPNFCNSVRACLDGDVQVLAVTKARFDVDFLNEVRQHPKVEVYNLTDDNWDEVYAAIKDRIY